MPLLFNKINSAVRAGRDADPIKITFTFIKHCSSVYDADRFFRTDLDTFTAAATLVFVVAWSIVILLLLPFLFAGGLCIEEDAVAKGRYYECFMGAYPKSTLICFFLYPSRGY